MEVFYCNLNKFNEEIEEFVIAKNKIESSLKLQGNLEKKMTVNEFISYVKKFNDVFIIEASKMIPFHIYDLINGDKVVILSSSNTEEMENLFKGLLKKINYDFNNCKKISYTELLENSINDPYFSINNEIYVVP